ncbi:hypothetical protein [Streptomyces sp. NBC_00842]|nr:hypothetical protein OH821_04535 [Streptomyces sp. NBC_00842]
MWTGEVFDPDLRPGAEDGTSEAMNMAARRVGSMALVDLTVHA